MTSGDTGPERIVPFDVLIVGGRGGSRPMQPVTQAAGMTLNNLHRYIMMSSQKEAAMRKTRDMQQKETVDLLNKCWMTHDGMWFFHCLQEYGIEAANTMNKSAIRALSSFEIARLKRALHCTDPMERYEEFVAFFNEAALLLIPDFMQVTFSYPEENTVSWQFTDGHCFAYTGIKRMEAIEQYECGVLYRIQCWLDELNIGHRFVPEIGRCHMQHTGTCSGIIQLFFPDTQA